jgi:hypothetical protein
MKSRFSGLVRFLTPIGAGCLLVLAPAATPAGSLSLRSDRSWCGLPDALPGLSTPVVVPVLVHNENGPWENATVTVTLTLESGELTPGQTMSVTAVTNFFGVAEPTFPAGIAGYGEVRLEARVEGEFLCARSYPLFTGPKLALHVHQREPHAGAPDMPCSELIDRGRLGVEYDVLIVASHVEGMTGLTCGISYDGEPGRGVDVTGWYGFGGLFFPADDWPAPGTGIRLTWGSCRDAPAFPGEGVLAVVAALNVYAYSPDVLQLTPNQSHVPEELFLLSCGMDEEKVLFAEHGLGNARFTSDGAEPGYNPCSGSKGYQSPPEPPIPPGPPVVPASILLHVGDIAGEGCGAAPDSVQSVITSAPADPGGGALYYVYVLAAGAHDEGMENTLGLRGMQFGIEYDPDSPERRALAVHSWNLCSDLEFPADAWPGTGSGNTLTWVECRQEPLAVAGFLYVTAYGPSTLSVTEFQPTGSIKVADCAGAEAVLNQVLERGRVGWVSMGGAAIGPDSDGCNPVLEPCLGQVPIRPTTWGRLKAAFGH